MGDGFDVVRQRMEDSSLRERANLKNLGKDSGKEVINVKDLPTEPKDMPERNSGEPGEPGEPEKQTVRIQDPGLLKTDLTEMVVAEPEVPFPYADTKLRPEAPPFTPECVSPNPEPAYGEPDTDNSCFVNVDLKLPTREDELFPEVDISGVVKHPKDNELKDARLVVKPFSITPQLKKSVPDIEIPEAGDEEPPIVAVRPTTSAVSETRETPVIERVRIFSPAFFFANRTQIIIVVASILVCVILVIFVLV